MTYKADTPHSGNPIRIDLDAVLTDKLGSKARFVPRWMVRKLSKLICQDRLNEMLRIAHPRRGAAFCSAVLDYLHISIKVRHSERLPQSGRAIFVCNHPLGGLDGMALIRFITEHYGMEPRFVVNDLLMAVEPLSDVFLPVNKHGAQSRHSAGDIDEAMASDVPVIIFPAGLCSRRREGVVADLAWHKMFVQKARRWSRPVVPLHFAGENSDRFYTWAARRERLGIAFNAEMVLLPSEIFKAEGSTYTITCGSPLSPDDLKGDQRQVADRIRSITYSL